MVEVLRGNCLSELCCLCAQGLSIAWIVASLFEHCVAGGRPGWKEVERVAHDDSYESGSRKGFDVREVLGKVTSCDEVYI